MAFISFLSSLTGTVLMFKAFGFFAAVAIGINFILGIVLFPCSIIIWERHVRQIEQQFRCWLRDKGLGMFAFGIHSAYYDRFKDSGDSSDKKLSMSYNKETEVWAEKSAKNLAKGMVDIGYGLQTLEELNGEYRRYGVLVGVHWIQWLHKTWVKAIVICVSAVWFAIAMYGVLLIHPLEENENFAAPDSFFMRSLYGMNDFTTTLALKNTVHITFGTNGLKSGSRDVWKEHFGVIDYVKLEVHTIPQQQWLLDFCGGLRNYTTSVNEESVNMMLTFMLVLLCRLLI